MTLLKLFLLIAVTVVLVGIVGMTVKHTAPSVPEPTQPTVLSASPTLSPSASSVITSIPFTRLNVSFSHAQAGQYVIRSQEDWDALGVVAEASPAPLNFNQEMVIVDVMGDKLTGGYDTLINTVQDTDSDLMITLTHTSPGPGCITTQSITHPVSVITLAKTAKPVHFTVIDKTSRC